MPAPLVKLHLKFQSHARLALDTVLGDLALGTLSTLLTGSPKDRAKAFANIILTIGVPGSAEAKGVVAIDELTKIRGLVEKGALATTEEKRGQKRKGVRKKKRGQNYLS